MNKAKNDNVKDLDVLTPIYNLMQHNDNSPVYNGPSVAIRPSFCAVFAIFLYTLNDLVVLYFT